MLVEVFHLPPARSSAIGYLASAVLNYLANRWWTFAADTSHAQGIARFVAMVALGLACNTALMYLFTTGLGINYLLAQVVATGAVLCLNFVVARYWVFAGR